MCVGGPSKKHFDGSPRCIGNAYSDELKKKKVVFGRPFKVCSESSKR